MSIILRQSTYAHLAKLGAGRALIFHALTQLRVAVDDEAAGLFSAFLTPRWMPDETNALARQFGCDPLTFARAVAALVERGFLTEKTPREEAAAVAADLNASVARNDCGRLDAYRRARREGGADYWARSTMRRLADLGQQRRRVNLALFGDCDVQREAEFLRLEGEARGIDVRVGATFAEDVAYASDRPADVVVIGALKARAAVAAAPNATDALLAYFDEARRLIGSLRQRASAPILIDNLPEPTVEPLGLAERGAGGHRNRFRSVNLGLSALVEDFEDVHVVDIAAALARQGSASLLDDGLFSFTHFGSPGWLLARPESERAAVHNIFPDLAPLVESVDGDPYGRERIAAKAHIDAVMTLLAINQKKLVVVDLDGLLWPGVLAETGAPFAWSPEISGLASYFGLYLGLHEALRMLKRRGVILAAASKNDEANVRALWRYPENYPRERLLTPDDFAAWRINWRDKPGNIRELAAELGAALDSVIFIDDSAHERERVSAELPEVEVWGENPFDLRRRLLTDPRLQRPRLTAEAARRAESTKSRAERERLRATSAGEATFLATLNVECRVERAEDAATRSRVVELFQRTTQFNATGRQFTAPELADPKRTVFAMRVRDRLADHGLVAAAVVEAGEILNFAMSCRVIGLNAEQDLLAALVVACGDLRARIVETARNAPVRNLYRDGGFELGPDGLWRKGGAASAAA